MSTNISAPKLGESYVRKIPHIDVILEHKFNEQRREANRKSKTQVDVHGNKTQIEQKHGEMKRPADRTKVATGGGGEGSSGRVLPLLPPPVHPEAAAKVVRRAAATLAWASGDGSVLSTAEALITRLHPTDHSAPLSQTSGPFHIPTLPPWALLRHPPSSTELLVQALRRHPQHRMQRETDPRRLKCFLDAMIHEYLRNEKPVEPRLRGLRGKPARSDVEAMASPSSRGISTAPTASPSLCPAMTDAAAQVDLGARVHLPTRPLQRRLSYEALLKESEKSVMPRRPLGAAPAARARPVSRARPVTRARPVSRPVQAERHEGQAVGARSRRSLAV